MSSDKEIKAGKREICELLDECLNEHCKYWHPVNDDLVEFLDFLDTKSSKKKSFCKYYNGSNIESCRFGYRCHFIHLPHWKFDLLRDFYIRRKQQFANRVSTIFGVNIYQDNRFTLKRKSDFENDSPNKRVKEELKQQAEVFLNGVLNTPNYIEQNSQDNTQILLRRNIEMIMFMQNSINEKMNNLFQVNVPIGGSNNLKIINNIQNLQGCLNQELNNLLESLLENQ